MDQKRPQVGVSAFWDSLCRGTRPRQGEKCRPFLNRNGSPIMARRTVTVRTPHARTVLSRLQTVGLNGQKSTPASAIPAIHFGKGGSMPYPFVRISRAALQQSKEPAESYGLRPQGEEGRALVEKKRQEGNDVKSFSAAYRGGMSTTWRIEGNHEGTIKEG